MLFYVVIFLVVQGEPHTIKDEKNFYYSIEECLQSANQSLNEFDEVLRYQPESFVTGACLPRDFSSNIKH